MRCSTSEGGGALQQECCQARNRWKQVAKNKENKNFRQYLFNTAPGVLDKFDD